MDIPDDWNMEFQIERYKETFDRAIAFAVDYPDTLWCYGNHDVSYPWGRLESGYSPYAVRTVMSKIEELENSLKSPAQINIIHRIDNVLFSHGGLTADFLKWLNADLLFADIDDVKHHKIIVDHQLIRSSKMQYMIEEPKTESGVREIPMSEEVEEAFRAILAKRVKPKVEPMIDGYSGFLYLDKNNMPMVALHWEKYFQHILQKYNSIYKVQMPKVTPHVCRHTFCSKMAKSGMNPKSLQYIMGHSDISVTLNTYTHVKFEDAEAEMKRVAAI